MALRAGAAWVDILANLAPLKAQLATGLQTDMKGAGASAGASLMAGMKAKLGNVKSLLPKGGFGAALGLGAIGGALAGIKAAADHAADLAEQVEDLSEITGTSAEEASRLAAVMRSLGIDVDSSQRPFLNLSKVLESGGKSLRNFFTEKQITELRSGTLSEAVGTLSSRFKALEGQQEQNAFLVASFGTRGAVAMRELLEATDGQIDKAIELAEANGEIFNDENLKDAKAYKIAMRQFGQSLDSLKTAGGKTVIPLLTDITDGIVAIGQSAKDGAGFLDRHLLDPIGDFMEKYGTVHVDQDTPQWIKDMFPQAEKANASLEELDSTLTGLKERTLEGDEDAAKELGEALQAAFELAERAAADFEKRVGSFIPDLGDTFKGLLTPSDVAEKVEEATESVAEAEERLADARAKLAEEQGFINPSPKQARELAEAQREVAEAERDLADAREELKSAGKFEDALGVGDLKATLLGNVDVLEQFVNGMGSLKARLEASGGLDEIEEAFLAHLTNLGPAAVPLLQELANVTDAELANLAGIFGNQIKAAKKAADLQFDLFPANFKEKMLAARTAAADELGNLIDEINALPEGADLSAWEPMVQAIALQLGQLDEIGKIHLTSLEEGFLKTATGAGSIDEKVRALKDLLASLTGKQWPVVLEFTGGGGGDSGGHGATGSWGPKKRHSGGAVRAGEMYNVLPNEEIFVPTQNGMVIPTSNVTHHNKTTDARIENVTVVAHDYNDFERQMEQKRRLAALTGE